MRQLKQFLCERLEDRETRRLSGYPAEIYAPDTTRPETFVSWAQLRLFPDPPWELEGLDLDAACALLHRSSIGKFQNIYRVYEEVFGEPESKAGEATPAKNPSVVLGSATVKGQQSTCTNRCSEQRKKSECLVQEIADAVSPLNGQPRQAAIGQQLDWLASSEE